ncbi:hypothetical protein ACFQ0M_01020 [Kitasatospora aburaviensis]
MAEELLAVLPTRLHPKPESVTDSLAATLHRHPRLRPRALEVLCRFGGVGSEAAKAVWCCAACATTAGSAWSGPSRPALRRPRAAAASGACGRGWYTWTPTPRPATATSPPASWTSSPTTVPHGHSTGCENSSPSPNATAPATTWRSASPRSTGGGGNSPGRS